MHVSPPIDRGHHRGWSACEHGLSERIEALQADDLDQALTKARAALEESQQRGCVTCERLTLQQLASISSQLSDYRQAALYFLRLQQLGETLPGADVRELSALSYQLCMVLDQSAQTSRWLDALQHQLTQRLAAQEHQLRQILDLPSPSLHQTPHQLDASISHTSSTAIDFEIRCLGQLAVYRNGQPLALPRNRKAELILKYLVMYRDQPVARDVLMELAWPGLAPDAVANNLNTTISLLRNTLAKALDSAIPGTPIVHEDGAYSLNPALNIQIDIAEFDRCYAQGRAHERAGARDAAMRCYQAALDLYQGELLLGDLVDDRTVIERERLTSTFLTLLGKLGDYYLAQGCYEEAIEYAHRLLKHDPCREDAHCTLMRSFARLGQRSRALRQYELCQSFLQRELEIEPAAATTQLCQCIARGEAV